MPPFTKPNRKSRLLAIVAVLLVAFASCSGQVSCLDKLKRYRVCTVEDLRRSVSSFCREYGFRRASNSDTELNSYGSASLDKFDGADLQLDGLPEKHSHADDKRLLELLKESKKFSSRHSYQHSPSLAQKLTNAASMKRSLGIQTTDSELCDYISECCQESCLIESEKLLAYCSSI